MIYFFNENRFCKQVTIQASSKNDRFLNVRENPEMPLPDEAIVILVPEGECTTD
jgi:DNA/RNA-binding domain of Phe-tRNA-synthetase-like protein